MPERQRLANLRVDTDREGQTETGIFVRAIRGDRWVSADIADLDRASLIAWLRSEKQIAMNTVLALLGHTHLTEGE